MKGPFVVSLKTKNSDSIIKKANKLRNSNPISHASAGLIKNSNSTDDLLNSIKNLKKLIKCKLDIIIEKNV